MSENEAEQERITDQDEKCEDKIVGEEGEEQANT